MFSGTSTSFINETALSVNKIRAVLLVAMCVLVLSACSSNKPQVSVDETQNLITKGLTSAPEDNTDNTVVY